MGISYIPSPGDQISGAIHDIGGAIDKFMNPNRDLQLAVQRATATNPELMQQMADLEAANPGTLARMGLGAVGQNIASVSQSTAGATEQATRPGAAKTAVAQQGAVASTAKLTTDKNALTSDIVDSATKIVKADPSIKMDAALKMVTGQSAGERAKDQSEAKIIPIQTDIRLEALKNAGALPDDLSTVDWHQKAKDFLDGKMKDGGEATAYFLNDGTNKVFQEAIDGVKQERQIAASIAARGIGEDKSLDAFYRQNAAKAFFGSGGTGNIGTWQKILFDPISQERAKQLMSGAIKATTQEDKDLLAVAKVNKLQVDTDKLGPIIKANNDIATEMKRVDMAPSDQARQVAIQGLNLALDQRAAFGGMKVRASYNDRGFWRSGVVEYKDEKGNLVDQAVVNEVLADPVASDIMREKEAAAPNKTVSGALDLIAKPGVDVIGSLAAFRLQDKSPNKVDSRALEASLVTRGLIKRVGTNK